jgi:hypothetical protein
MSKRTGRIPGTSATRRTVSALVLVADPQQNGLTDRERIALTLRADATATGRCACGAVWPRLRLKRGKVTHATMLHAADCPAASIDVLSALAARLGPSLKFAALRVELKQAA